MYEIQRGKNGGSMKGLAQYLWPTVPSEGRVATVRMPNPMRGGGTIAAR